MKFLTLFLLFSPLARAQGVTTEFFFYASKEKKLLSVSANGMSGSGSMRIFSGTENSDVLWQEPATEIHFSNIVNSLDNDARRADLEMHFKDGQEIRIHPIDLKTCEVRSTHPKFLISKAKKIPCKYSIGIYRPGMSGGN